MIIMNHAASLVDIGQVLDIKAFLGRSVVLCITCYSKWIEILSMRVVGKGSYKEQEVGKILVGENSPTSSCSIKKVIVGKLSFEKFFQTSLTNFTYAVSLTEYKNLDV